MNQVKQFNHKLFGELPVRIVDDVEWFGATEAAKALGFVKPLRAIENHVDLEDVTVWGVGVVTGRKQDFSDAVQTVQKKFINESGLYSLILGASKQGNNAEIKAKAKQFKRWVTSEVLPSIRKDGAYVQATENEDDATILARGMLAAQRALERKDALILEHKRLLDAQKPKVRLAEAIQVSKTAISISEFAKILNQNGINIGQNRFYEWLRQNGYIIRQRGIDYNMPTQKAMNLGLFRIKESPFNSKNGLVFINRTARITGKGQAYFVNKFLKDETKNMGGSNQ